MKRLSLFALIVIITLLNAQICFASASEEISYGDYLAEHKDISYGIDAINVDAVNYKSISPAFKTIGNYAGDIGASLSTEEEGYVEWEIDIPAEGLYCIKMRYIQIKGRNSSIEREVVINGEKPYVEAGRISLKRLWKDETDIITDSNGNDVKPRQVEYPIWQEGYLYDDMGYHSSPLKFFFRQGTNIIRFNSIKEPLVIKNITICPAEENLPYSQAAQEYIDNGYKDATKSIIIQGEASFYKSDPTLCPINDRSSPATVPYSPSKIKLNTIGGYRWAAPGQFIVWKFNIEEEGLYKISIKARQNIVRGMFSNRKIMIDGKVPFSELDDVRFNYKSTWQMIELGDSSGAYKFFLTKGEHEIRMDSNLGDMGEILNSTQDCLYQLNSIYRKILIITGTVPDYLRDYRLETLIPDDIKELGVQAKVLESISKMLLDYTGQRGSDVAILDILARQVKKMSERPYDIPQVYENFKGNLGALGAWLINARQQPLEIDYITVSPPGGKLPKADAGFFARVLHEVKAFYYSFIENYNSLGDTSENIEFRNEKPVRIWVTTGRDQGQIIKNILDDTFSPKTNIRTKLEIVQHAALLPATVSGMGPDIALNIGGSEPVNYALRNAVYNLASFKDYEEISKRFNPQATVPYKYNGGVYALPETQTFPMLFYRSDILNELGLQVPQTWDDVINMVPVLSKNNMSFVLPVSTTAAPGSGMGSYYTLLLQKGGNIYKSGGIASDLDSNIAISAFKQWTNFYLNYKFPLQYDFINRFRTGETPIGIADYSTYNVLMVSAPEIRGLWNFDLVPGTKSDDGKINRSVPGSGSACIILNQTKQPENAWELLKWWTEASTQFRFAFEMESLLGPSARYPTANLEVFSQLPWSVSDYKVLNAQREWVRGIEEVPGSYFTPRHIDNAFRKVIYYWEDPKDTLLDYVYDINLEISGKRKEFGLKYIEPVRKGGNDNGGN